MPRAESSDGLVERAMVESVALTECSHIIVSKKWVVGPHELSSAVFSRGWEVVRGLAEEPPAHA
jgi:hypothetical protein